MDEEGDCMSVCDGAILLAVCSNVDTVWMAFLLVSTITNWSIDLKDSERHSEK